MITEELFAQAHRRAARETAAWRTRIALPWDADRDPDLDRVVRVLLALAYATRAARAGRPVGDIPAGQAARLLIDDPAGLLATRPEQIPSELWSQVTDGWHAYALSWTDQQHDIPVAGDTPTGGRLTLVPVPTPTQGPGWGWGRCYSRALLVLLAVDGEKDDAR